MPPEHSGTIVPPKSIYDRTLTWAAGLPWWAIILLVVAVAVLYSMVTSSVYRDIIESLTDDPQVSTDELFEVVQIVGEPTMIVGRYVGETQDSVQSVITQLLRNVIESELVTQSGFIQAADPATITIRTETGLVTIPRDRIETMEPPDATIGDDATITYIERITITGTLTERDGDTMTIRTVDEQIETFEKSRILSREGETIPCDREADPDCEDQEQVTIERAGREITGTLSTLSQTNLSLQPEGSPGTVEFRMGDLDFLYVPTLTIALHEAIVEQPVQPGDEVRIGFVEGTDITAALAEMENLEDVPVPLRYSDGTAQVVLVPYPDLAAALEATGAGELDATIYLDDGPERLAAADWVDENPDAGVVLPNPPSTCDRHCEVTVKLQDDTVSGIVVDETDEQISVRTQAAEYVVIDRDQIVDNRRMEPGTCALNNLRGCNEGIFLTLRVTFLAYGLALIIGLFVGLMRVSHNPVIYAISTLYVEVIRGIPLLVILLYAGFVFSPWLRDNTPLQLSDEWEAIIGLAFGYGAFVAEIFRAGIQSISRGQMEAARSLGMNYPQSMRYVILPQAVRVVLPPLGNDFIAMLKDSALISVLALPDLLQLGRLHISRTFRAFEGYNTVAILYLLMTLFLSFIVRTIERRARLPR
ncbi:MAG: amino acid ABC transporter permease [Chloroflexi bacterium]|nr:amino acid ABC transporter permease [Chloroflexota bacterium]